MPNWYNGPPGIQAARTASHRALFLQRSETFLAQGRIIDGSKSRDPGNTGDVNVLRAGLVMGKITSGGKYAPSVLGTLVSGGTVGSVALTVSTAVATELVRRQGASGTFKITGPPVAAGVVQTETVTYSAIVTATGVITCTATINAYIAGSLIQPTDGSEVPLTMLPDWDYGVWVQDQDGLDVSAVDFPKLPVSGIVDVAQLLPWPADTSLQLWLVARLNDGLGGQFVFSGVGGRY